MNGGSVLFDRACTVVSAVYPTVAVTTGKMKIEFSWNPAVRWNPRGVGGVPTGTMGPAVGLNAGAGENTFSDTTTVGDASGPVTLKVNIDTPVAESTVAEVDILPRPVDLYTTFPRN